MRFQQCYSGYLECYFDEDKSWMAMVSSNQMNVSLFLKNPFYTSFFHSILLRINNTPCTDASKTHQPHIDALLLICLRSMRSCTRTFSSCLRTTKAVTANACPCYGEGIAYFCEFCAVIPEPELFDSSLLWSRSCRHIHPHLGGIYNS